MKNESMKDRAAQMKAGPNSIVEEIGKSTPKRVISDPQPTNTDPVEGRELQPMKLRTFLSLEFGLKRFDQAAGFAHHAKNLGPRTIHEWRKALGDFHKKPVK